jgi:hypothetical protein
MSNPTRDPQHQKNTAEELQSQRQRLHQAWTDGASLEHTATLMHSVLRLLPGTGTKRRPRSPLADMHPREKLGR